MNLWNIFVLVFFMKLCSILNALKNLNCAGTPDKNREENYVVENVEIEPQNRAEISVSLDESNNITATEKTPKRRSLMGKLVDTLTRSKN